MFEGESLRDTSAFSILAFDRSNPQNCKPIKKVIVILKIMPWKHLKAKFIRLFRQMPTQDLRMWVARPYLNFS